MAKKKSSSPEPGAPVPPSGSAPAPAPNPPASPTGASYTVLARRYRPQQFRDLVGQEAIAQALVNALESHRVAHAYLFTGARGVGKTSTARILAKALNCVQGPTPTPCDQCESCQAIAAGEDVDVLEIDGASNNKVEEVRELRQNVQYRPARSRYKIYIIDEVHMLSTSAFNALLKTLEEPPPHVKFIFATTEVQKIPVTILSRCQRFDFTGIGSKRILERLRQIVAEEGAEADAEALEILARRASGSMRDAQSLLDQMLAFGGRRVTVEQVHHLLGTANEEQVAALARAILQRDLPAALTLLGQAAEQGVQFGELLDQLLDYWRDLMVLNAAGAAIEGLIFPPRFHESQQQQAQAITLDTLLAGMDILTTTKVRLRGTSHARVLMEMAVVRLTRLENLASLAQLAQLLAGNGTAPRPPASAPNAAGPKKMLPAERNTAPGETARPGAAAPAPRVADGKTLLPPSGLEVTPATLGRIWQAALEAISPMHSAQLARAGLPAIIAPNCLVLRFPAGYNGEKEYCEEASRNERLEEVLRLLTKQGIAVRYEALADRGGPGGDSPETRARPSRSQQLRSTAAQEPLVKSAMETLGAQLLHVDEGFGTPPVPRGVSPDLEEPSDDV